MSTYDKEYDPDDYLLEPRVLAGLSQGFRKLLKIKQIMNVTILSVDIKTIPTAKGSYQTAEVAYKNNTFQGKVEGKKIMSFGATASSFKTLTTAVGGDTYEVEIVKNDKGYNDWVSMTKASADAVAPATGFANGSISKPTATTAVRSTYETPEERAAKQVYIVKQSSIANAVSTLSVGAKTVKGDDVIELAKKYTAFVFGQEAAAAAQVANVTGFEDIPDFDVPEVN